MVAAGLPDTNVWLAILVEGITSRTCTSKVYPVRLVGRTFNHLPLAGSWGRGYVCKVAKLSLLQTNDNELSSNLTYSPASILWIILVVILIIPV